LIEVSSGIENTRLDAPNIHGVEAKDPHFKFFTRLAQMCPKRVRVVMGFCVIFPSQFIRVTRAGNPDFLSAERHLRRREIPERRWQPCIACGLQNFQRVRPLDLRDKHIRVGNRDIHGCRVSTGPTVKITIGLCIPECVCG